MTLLTNVTPMFNLKRNNQSSIEHSLTQTLSKVFKNAHAKKDLWRERANSLGFPIQEQISSIVLGIAIKSINIMYHFKCLSWHLKIYPHFQDFWSRWLQRQTWLTSYTTTTKLQLKFRTAIIQNWQKSSWMKSDNYGIKENTSTHPSRLVERAQMWNRLVPHSYVVDRNSGGISQEPRVPAPQHTPRVPVPGR